MQRGLLFFGKKQVNLTMQLLLRAAVFFAMIFSQNQFAMRKYSFQFVLSIVGGLIGAFFFHQIQKSRQVPADNAESRSIEARYTYHPEEKEAKNERFLFGNEDFVQASALSTPSVVYIKTVARARQSVDLFDYFFGGGGSRGGVLSSGSGVIYSSDGYIITNNHVIDGAEKIEVVHQKSIYEAKVVGKDPSTDLAVLKVEAKNLPNIKVGSSREVRVGDWVLAVGNPFNLTSTVTAGIVSAKGRNIRLLNSQFPIESFIQTDAAINPGNSGGALVNLKGELVGINTAILSQTGSYAGYGFAVPMDIVQKVVKDLIRYKEVQKAFIGLEVQELNSKIAQEYKLKDLDGVMVTGIIKGESGEKAGIREGDVILKINDENILGRSDYDEVLSYFSPGDKISLSIRRDGRIEKKEVVLTNREGTTEVLKNRVVEAELLGAALESLSKVERNRLNVAGGVRIVKVNRGLFAQMGLQEGFIITKINNVNVAEPAEVEGLLEQLSQKGGRVVIEGISRNGSRGYYSFIF